MTTTPETLLAEAAAVAGRLSKAQRTLVLASDQDDVTITFQHDQREGCGVEIRGAQYRTAKALMALGLGDYTHGSPYSDMYWNNAFGLAVRQALAAGGEVG